MRIEGTVAKWSNDRGFGFIAPDQGGPDVFVHISAFPQDGIRPSLGDRFSFEIEADAGGKRRAVKLLRIKRAVVQAHAADVAPRAKAGSAMTRKVIALLILAGLVFYYGYAEHARHRAAQQLMVEPAAPQ